MRYLEPMTSAGPIVAARGGTAARSPLIPKLPWSEFCAKVNGLSVTIRELHCFHCSSGMSNSGASGSNWLRVNTTTRSAERSADL